MVERKGRGCRADAAYYNARTPAPESTCGPWKSQPFIRAR